MIETKRILKKTQDVDKKMPYVSGLNKKTKEKLKTKELLLVVQLLLLLFSAVKLVFSALLTTSTLNAKVTENKSKIPDGIHFVGTPEFDKLESKNKKKRINIK